MSIYNIKNSKVTKLSKESFKNERQLQTFVENNLENLLNIHFLSSEYTTSSKHGGRIDTLGLDENNSPVIIEYKWGEKDNIINQGLFYLDWLVDHDGAFQILVQKKLKKDIKVDYGSPRLILIAQNFNKYDTYAINRMAENIELYSYTKYEKNIFELKLVASSQAKSSNKKQITKIKYANYSIENYFKNKPKKIREIFNVLQEKILSLETDQPIKEFPRRHYIAYKTNKNFVETLVQTNTIKVYIDLPINKVDDPKKIVEDVSTIGRLATGSSCIKLSNIEEVDYVIQIIKQSYIYNK